jgi:plastocyanin
MELNMAKTYTVDIRNMKFNPASVTISKGDTVTWANVMDMAHTVTPDADGFPGSGPIGKNKTFSHLFDAAGTIAYHCEIHPEMTGTVIVN